jgi:hypothetical protein
MVRTVNWVLVDGTWYNTQGDPPSRSHLMLLVFDRDLRVVETADVYPPEDMPPPQFSLDLGFADPRPFIWRGNLWCVCHIREFNEAGRYEMVLARVRRVKPGHYALSDWRLMRYGTPTGQEKNWMPQVVGDELRLIYSVDPTRILTDLGAVLQEEPAPVAAENFRGGSQALAFDDGWLMVIHEVEWVNGSRQYYHRFIWMDATSPDHSAGCRLAK